MKSPTYTSPCHRVVLSLLASILIALPTCAQDATDFFSKYKDAPHTSYVMLTGEILSDKIDTAIDSIFDPPTMEKLKEASHNGKISVSETEIAQGIDALKTFLQHTEICELLTLDSCDENLKKEFRASADNPKAYGYEFLSDSIRHKDAFWESCWVKRQEDKITEIMLITNINYTPIAIHIIGETDDATLLKITRIPRYISINGNEVEIE